MTKEEAIIILDTLWDNPLFNENHREALKIGVQAIKRLGDQDVLQEPIHKVCGTCKWCEQMRTENGKLAFCNNKEYLGKLIFNYHDEACDKYETDKNGGMI